MSDLLGPPSRPLRRHRPGRGGGRSAAKARHPGHRPLRRRQGQGRRVRRSAQAVLQREHPRMQPAGARRLPQGRRAPAPVSRRPFRRAARGGGGALRAGAGAADLRLRLGRAVHPALPSLLRARRQRGAGRVRLSRLSHSRARRPGRGSVRARAALQTRRRRGAAPGRRAHPGRLHRQSRQSDRHLETRVRRSPACTARCRRTWSCAWTAPTRSSWTIRSGATGWSWRAPPPMSSPHAPSPRPTGWRGCGSAGGYAAPAVIDAMDRIRAPFNVNVPAQAAALAALEDDAFLERSRALVHEERPPARRRVSRRWA